MENTINAMQGKRFATIPECSRIFNIPKCAFYGWNQKGILPVIKSGTHCHIDLIKLEKLFEEQPELFS